MERNRRPLVMGSNISKLIPSVDVTSGGMGVVLFGNVPFVIKEDVDALPIEHLISASR